MGSDCQNPYLDGISVDSKAPYKINAVANYVVGWSDQVCLVCENVDQKVAIEITIDQLPCNLTNNCPAHGGNGLEEGSGSCKGFLDHVLQPAKINFPYTLLNKPQYSEIVATQFFVNKNATECPITKCTMMDNDCDEQYVDGIGIEPFAPFRINAKTDFDNGW